MAIQCPKCGTEYDVTLFEYGHRVRCDCGAWVDLAVGHQQLNKSPKSASIRGETSPFVQQKEPARKQIDSMNNLYSHIPDELPAELVQTLAYAESVRIERIVSHGHASPPEFWYDQQQNEWVVLLTGAARLRFEDAPTALNLSPGDFVNIPAHRRHRVEWTTPAEPTVWLAVHYG